MSNIIAILTDFGLEDIYIGVMKAVMLNIFPEAQIIDITHAISPQNVREGAFSLLNAYSYFPQGTTFCAVVDPGVGSTRVPIAVEAYGYNFIAPDNGLLSYLLGHIDNYSAVALENPKFRLQNVSRTFHGRDIFAPAAAYLARGDIALNELGRPHDKLFTFPQPEMTIEERRIIGEVIHIDHFGNVITSIGKLDWENEDNLLLRPFFGDSKAVISIKAESVTVSIHSFTIHGISHAYHEVNRGSILTQIDSNGYLEIGANQDNAATRIDAIIGDKVVLSLGK